jgi:hypothetical protein
VDIPGHARCSGVRGDDGNEGGGGGCYTMYMNGDMYSLLAR